MLFDAAIPEHVIKHIDISMPEQVIEVPTCVQLNLLALEVPPRRWCNSWWKEVPWVSPSSVFRVPKPHMENQFAAVPPIVSQQLELVPQSFRNVAGERWCRVRATGSTGG